MLHDFEAHADTLLDIARQSVRHGLDQQAPLAVDLDATNAPLRRHGAAFVTLKRNGALRGCIGSVRAYRPLAVDVADNAYGAAFRDPRFPPLSDLELDGLHLSVSVLTAPEPLPVVDEADLLRRLRPLTDGLIIESGSSHALFLPAVWEQLPEPALFLAHLKAKAGLDPHSPTKGLQAWRFEAVQLRGNGGSMS